MRRNPLLIYGLLAGATLGIVALSLQTGVYTFTWKELFQVFGGADHPQAGVILNLRLPRIAMALLTGGMLTLSGFLMQAVVRNPLAEPYIMGVSSGAGLGVNLLLLGLAPVAAFSLFTLPLFATAGAMASLLLVLALGGWHLQEDTSRLLIAGIAVSSLGTALVGMMLFFAGRDNQVRNIIFWTFGNFDRSSPESVGICALILGVGLALSRALAYRLDVLLPGEATATSLGLPVRRFRLGILLLASLLAGATVAFAGPVGFVGLMGPHFSRALFGTSHQHALVPGVWLGALFLAAADVLARRVLPPAGLPIGIVTALLGAPFFMYLLFRKSSNPF